VNPGRHQLIVRQIFPADAERVFRAWSRADEMRRWFSPVGFTTPFAEADVRPGGRYRIGMQPPGGNTLFVTGVYREVTPPDRLVFTWTWEGGEMAHAGETLVTVEFRTVPGGTEVVLTHELLPSEDAGAMHREGWNGCLASLRTHIGEPAAGFASPGT
jgi:uncharacterized protein YndB with AHSA1/START domain